jgi:hypothetical protein
MRDRLKNSTNSSSWAANEFVGRLFVGHAAAVMARMPKHSIDLVITSPPYWTAVEYAGGKNIWRSYEDYLADMQTVWSQCEWQAVHQRSHSSDSERDDQTTYSTSEKHRIRYRTQNSRGD